MLIAKAVTLNPDRIEAESPFAGSVFDADVVTMLALEGARVLSRLDEIPHEGFSLEDTCEEGWLPQPARWTNISSRRWSRRRAP
jgi:hypothetical protein